MKSILITGGNGYIASKLAASLKNKYDITTISRNNFDLTNYNDLRYFMKRSYYDVVIHCAAVGGSRLHTDSSSVVDNNLQMYYNLLQNRHSYNKLIHFGSGAELSTNTPYAVSKSIINQSISEQNNFYNLRIFAVFDEDELSTRFIKGNLIKYLNHNDLLVHQNKYMDFFYMQDLLTLVEYYIEQDNVPKQIDCVYQDKQTLLDIANIINRLTKNRVGLTLLDNTMGTSYTGSYMNLDLSYKGLEQGITDVYNKLI